MIVKSNDLDALIFDFDGVLTDNRVLVFSDGAEAVICNRADGLAFDHFRAVGFPVYIVSTETNPVVRARGAKLQVPVIDSVSDKAVAIRELCADHGYTAERLMFVGNDLNDLPALNIVGYPVAVADAHPKVLASVERVLTRKGGEGVARELMESVIDFEPAD
ncbi:MAG: HAD hydrolase family protein [Alphaproteobacteria bacterium]|jgi:3-deoxy-D-manno-octulosonate 8-phosphate phosphatase (KDO 8-P phosphatase)|nr:HAD hydrolase family protein [Alphaproteobacteria bacterium]